MNKPDWENAPRWANYLAMDANGTWYWYADEPFISQLFPDELWTERGKYIEIEEEIDTLFWKNSLERRPV